VSACAASCRATVRSVGIRCATRLPSRFSETGQGPRLGNGFALLVAPAEYGVTGVKTFIVSHDGVVYEKDFGPKTLDELLKMERFNPDKSWSPVSDRDD
jgi:hypothetical protein